MATKSTIIDLTLFFILSLITASHSVILPFLQPPTHDGVNRVCQLTKENFTNVVAAAEIAVVVFKDETAKSNCPTDLDKFAELTAQLLRKKNIIVCGASPSVTVTQQSTGTGPQYAAGDVFIFTKGQGKPYYGKRSTSAVLSFLFKVNDTQVNVITGKLDKIAFDAVPGPRVVGFFMQGAADYQAYQEAASMLSRSISFYAAFDRTVAKHLKLDTVGQIHLVKPPSKTPVVCPQNPATAADIEAFVNANRGGSLLTKINEHNLYDPQLLDSTRVLVLAIGEQSSSLGKYFHYLVNNLLRNNTNNTDFQKLNIVWLEPQIFPSIYLMMDELETTLGIPNILPAFGIVNVSSLQSAWLNTSALNLTADKIADQKNLQILQEFLNGVINNTVIPVKLGAQAFVQTPTSQALAEGSEAVLECIVENAVGDCLWLKDGRNIGFNLERYTHYSWRGNHAAGDCSLKITGVQKGRDDGEWVCEITGDLTSPTLSSSPAKIVISGTATGNTEL